MALLAEARELGFLGPGELVPQLAHARGFVETARSVGAPSRWLDLGSGGGLPGLVVAVDLPGTEGTLLDGMERRTTFLSRAVVVLRLEGAVTVVRSRAEDHARSPLSDGAFDMVMARGFGPPALAAECAARFLCREGHLLVSEPPDSAGERWAGLSDTDLGMSFIRVKQCAIGSIAVIRKSGATPPRYPRRGPALRRPLFTSP